MKEKLQRELREILAAQRELVKILDTRQWTEEETARYNELEGKYQASERNWDALLLAEERERKFAGIDQPDQREKKLVVVEKESPEQIAARSRQILKEYLLRGWNGMKPESKQWVAEHRAQSAGTTTEGGFTVDDSMAMEIQRGLKSFGGVLEVATIINTDKGEDIDFPKNDDTGNTGALLSENTQASEQDTTFGNTTLGAFKYTSKVIRVSRELLTDSKFDIAAHITSILTERIWRIINSHLTTGTGSSQPNGIVTASTAGVTSANTNPTFTDLTDLKHSVDPAYRMSAGTAPKWMFNDTTLREIKQQTIGSSDGRALWQPGWAVGEPATLDGDRYVINQDMASPADDAKTVLYGRFKDYAVRIVGNPIIYRLEELYGDFDQVAFVGFLRVDGDLVGAGASIKHLVAGAT